MSFSNTLIVIGVNISVVAASSTAIVLAEGAWLGAPLAVLTLMVMVASAVSPSSLVTSYVNVSTVTGRSNVPDLGS